MPNLRVDRWLMSFANRFFFGANLPLRWFRLPLLLATLAISIITTLVGLQTIRRIASLEKQLHEWAVEHNVGEKYTYGTKDIQYAAMLLSVVALSLGLSSLVFTSMLAIDWIAALLRSRGVKQGEEVAPTEIVPISTRSLGLQSKMMFILSAALISIVISTSFIVVTGKAKEIVTPGYSTVIDDDYEFNFDRVYLHHPFMRCVGIAPWLSILVIFPATFFTLIAARFSPTANRIDRHSLKDKD